MRGKGEASQQSNRGTGDTARVGWVEHDLLPGGPGHFPRPVDPL